MGSQKCRIVSKSQSVRIMINPIIYLHPHPYAHPQPEPQLRAKARMTCRVCVRPLCGHGGLWATQWNTPAAEQKSCTEGCTVAAKVLPLWVLLLALPRPPPTIRDAVRAIRVSRPGWIRARKSANVPVLEGAGAMALPVRTGDGPTPAPLPLQPSHPCDLMSPRSSERAEAARDSGERPPPAHATLRLRMACSAVTDAPTVSCKIMITQMAPTMALSFHAQNRHHQDSHMPTPSWLHGTAPPSPKTGTSHIGSDGA
jgi:hypothetical protein